ncbi:DUF1742-domain-containing protein [Lactarius hatsudake]|nr:DUF1742-domain-containing protein [Lactarius hatsudake]
MARSNIYFKRATATSRAVYVCYKPTATCLATTNAVDFIYYLVDPDAPKEVVVSKEEIARVKAEWEAKEEARKKKDNKGKAPSSDKGGEATEGGPDEKKKSGDKSPSPSSSVPGSLPSTPAASSSGTTPTHKRYSLHRDFYAMRQAEHRRRRQAKQMQELAPRLPGAPRGSPIG